MLTYVGNSAVAVLRRGWESIRWHARSRLDLRMPSLDRKVFCLLYVGTVTGVVTLGAVVGLPVLLREAQYLVRLAQSDNPYVFVADSLYRAFGEENVGRIETFLRSAGRVGGAAAETAPQVVAQMRRPELASGPWTQERSLKFAALLMLSFKNNLVSVGTACSGLLKPAASLLYTGLISFIFSSLLLFDLPGITEGVASLRRSRLRRPYEELAPKLRTFGKLVGQGTQVQALIAIVNTVLTTLGLFVLKIPGTRFLSLVTLVCSFIPVAGVFIRRVLFGRRRVCRSATRPPPSESRVSSSQHRADGARGALRVRREQAAAGHRHGRRRPLRRGVPALPAGERGGARAERPPSLWERTPRRPRRRAAPSRRAAPAQIYAAKLKLHPLLVLVALYVTEHVVGVKGLFLTLPVTLFILGLIGVGDKARAPPSGMPALAS